MSKPYLREFKSNGPMIYNSSKNNSGGSPSRPGDFPFCTELNVSLCFKRVTGISRPSASLSVSDGHLSSDRYNLRVAKSGAGSAV